MAMRLRVLLLVWLAAMAAPTASEAIGWDADDFLVTDWCISGCFSPGGVLVYDQDFTFKGYLDAAFPAAYALRFLVDGRLVVIAHPGFAAENFVRVYDSTGALVGGFTNTVYDGDCSPVPSVGPDGHLYFGRQYAGKGIREVDLAGNLIRDFGMDRQYSAVAFGPDDRLWAQWFADSITHGQTYDRFDLSTGLRIDTRMVDLGQPAFGACFLDRTNDSILMGVAGPSVWERDAAGTLIRVYPDEAGGSHLISGVTRGPGESVYAARSNSVPMIHYWAADGNYLGWIDLHELNYAVTDVVWAGTVSGGHLPPTMSGTGLVECALAGTNIQFDVSAADPEGTVITLSATSLPSGATFPTVVGSPNATGTFAWSPSALDTGNHVVTFSAVDSGAPPRTSTKDVTISVIASSPISTHPQPQSICAGQVASFFTTADASAYQWQFSPDGASWSNIAGATAAGYTTPPTSTEGYYRCIVSAACGAVATNGARLTITPLPASPGDSLRALRLQPSAVHFGWATCSAAASYWVRRCDAGAGPCIPTNLLNSLTNSAEDMNATAPSLWYEIVSVNACGLAR